MKKILKVLLILGLFVLTFTASSCPDVQDIISNPDTTTYDYNIPLWLHGTWEDSLNTITYAFTFHNINSTHGTGSVNFLVAYDGSTVNEVLTPWGFYEIRLTYDGSEIGQWTFNSIGNDSLTYTFSTSFGGDDTEGPMILTKR